MGATNPDPEVPACTNAPCLFCREAGLARCARVIIAASTPAKREAADLEHDGIMWLLAA